MRRWLLALLLVAGAALAGCSSSDGSPSPIPQIGPAKIDVDTPALRTAKRRAGIATCVPGSSSNGLPRVTLPCFGGGPDVRLDRLAGPLVVNLWGSWCEPCRAELPYYQRLSERLRGRVQVIGIDMLDPQTTGAMDLLTETGVTYPQLADTQEALRTGRPRLPTQFMPVVAMVDADGEIAYAGYEAITSYDQLADLVAEHLGINR